MSHEEAVAAIEAAARADAAADQADPFASPSDSPAGETTPQVQPAAAQPADPAAPAASEPVGEQPAPDTFDGGQFNPDELPPELRPAWRQLQAAFTRKTQELAEVRKQYDALGGLEVVQQAVELYHRIADPAEWPALHAELSQAMEAYGLTPAEAAAEATRQMEEAANAQQGPDLSALEQDPELAPLAAIIREQQQKLAQFEQMLSEREQAEEAERLHMALVGELTRQENAIRQARPDYSDEDIDAIYRLSSFYNGNLIEAQHAYEDIVAKRIERYVSAKESAATETASQTLPGAGVTSVQEKLPETLEEAEAWALEHVRGLQAQGVDLTV